MASQTVLVTAAGGNIGTELVPLLLSQNHSLVLPTTNANRLSTTLSLPSNAPVTIAQGAIQDPVWFESLIHRHRITAIFLCLTGTDELMTTLNILSALHRAHTSDSNLAKHVIYLSAAGDFISPAGFEAVSKAAGAAHVLVKPVIEARLKLAGYPWTTTVLGPTLFFGNDARGKREMLEGETGVFPEPLSEHGVSRVAPADIAFAVVRVLEVPGKWDGRKVMVGSRKVYKGSEIAELWSQALGRRVEMVKPDADGLAAVEERFTAAFASGKEPGDNDRAWGRDLRLMYEMFAQMPFAMTEEDYATQVELLGREPADYEAWVRKTGREWQRP